MLDKHELALRFYSPDNEKKKSAIYQVLFERRSELLHDLKKAVNFEQNEKIAVLMVQVCMVLKSFPRNFEVEKRILGMLKTNRGVSDLLLEQWKYLEYNAPSKVAISVLGCIEGVPIAAHNFIESCLTSIDPLVRTMACRVGVKSGRPTHFVHLLRLIQDKDKQVAETAFKTVSDISKTDLGLILDCSLSSPDTWLLENIAPFLPLLITEELRWIVSKIQYHKHPLVGAKAKETINKLNNEVNK